MNNKGFTLVEILAVFVIIGILSLIAIPSVSNAIESSRKEALIEQAKTYLKSFETQLINKEYITSDNDLCKIPPVGYYTIIKIKEISTENTKEEQEGKIESPWGFEINDSKSSVIVINEKTSETQIGDEVVGNLKYYIHLEDVDKNGIVRYHTKIELNKSLVKNSTTYQYDSKNSTTPNISKKAPVTIENTKYQFYQECKGVQ